jgi:hypothetical protein
VSNRADSDIRTLENRREAKSVANAADAWFPLNPKAPPTSIG